MTNTIRSLVCVAALGLACGAAAHAAEATGAASALAAATDLLPRLDGAAMTWFAVVIILLLTVTVSPLRSMRNADGFVLAATCLLLGLRFDEAALTGADGGLSGQWWSYLLLGISGAYWLFRGGQLLLSGLPSGVGCNVSKAAMAVLVLAGVGVAVGRITTDPISDGSRDGLIGGARTAANGKLPYGNAVGHESRSPLVYLAHAGALKLTGDLAETATSLPPTSMPTSSASADLLDESIAAGQRVEDSVAARVVNGVSLILMLAGLFVIGRRLHSTPMGLTLVTVFCVFPGATECLTQPEIMLPTVLLTWSVAFATLPAVGGLLSVLTMVLAGLAWPWAWLLLPVLLAWFFRRGWHAFGGTVGLLGGVAACVAGLTWLTQPTIPRADGAQAAAALPASYTARASDDGSVVIDALEGGAVLEKDFKSWAWKWLVEREACTLDGLGADGATSRPVLPNGVDASAVAYRGVDASEDVLGRLQEGYRASVADLPAAVRAWVALRTVLEATWLSEGRPAGPVKGTWELWGGTEPASQERWTRVRRIAIFGAGLISLVVAGLLLFGDRRQAHQLVGGLLTVVTVVLFCSRLGMATNWAWLLALVLALLAAHAGPPKTAHAAKREGDLEERMPIDLGPKPRISVER